MPQPPEWFERLARQLSEAEQPPRQPPRERYRLNWSFMLPYTNENVQFISEGGVGSSVYEIWQRVKGGRVAVYVGEAKILGDRLRDHMQKSEPNPKIRGTDFGMLMISYAPVEGPISRKAVERALWRLYNYIWNDPAGPQGGRVEGLVVLDECFPEAYTINFNGVRQPMLGVSSPVVLP